MSADPIQGFWGLPKNTSFNQYHYFLTDTAECVCGKWRLREITDDHQDRKPAPKIDCKKCVDIYQELFAVKPPAAPEPDWTVKTDPMDGGHILLFRGEKHSAVRGLAGLTAQKDLAAMFNKNGTVPTKGKKIRCAADAPNPAKFLEKKSSQSPALPLDLSTEPPAKMPKATAATATADQPVAPVVETFPASHYRRYPTNRNPDAEAVKNMSDSIREVGVLQPIIARTIPGDPEIEILAGETRWLGCKAIDPDYPVPCFLRNVDDKEAAKIHAIENFQRKDLTPFEEGREIQHMLSCGWEMEEVATHLGRSTNWLYKRQMLLKLPEEGVTAFGEGNLSLNTALKILSLPEEKQLEAVKAVSEPTHAASALSERDALELLDDEFVKPLEKAAEWEERRDLLESENPGCHWLKYEHAAKAGVHGSDYVRADYTPNRELLSDAAKLGELVVPTWKALAEKHAAPIYIGLAPWGPKEAVLYVSPSPIVDAEKAAFNDNPGDCIFSHEKAVEKSRNDAQRRKLEDEQRAEAVRVANEARHEERKKLSALILAPDGLTKTAVKKFMDRCHAEALDSVYLESDELAKLFDVVRGEDEDFTALRDRALAATAKYLKSKSLEPFEALGRLVMAGYALSHYCSAEEMFETGIAKPAEFPQFHADYQKRLAQLAAEKAAEEESAAAFADGEPESNREEATA